MTCVGQLKQNCSAMQILHTFQPIRAHYILERYNNGCYLSTGCKREMKRHQLSNTAWALHLTANNITSLYLFSPASFQVIPGNLQKYVSTTHCPLGCKTLPVQCCNKLQTLLKSTINGCAAFTKAQDNTLNVCGPLTVNFKFRNCLHVQTDQ